MQQHNDIHIAFADDHAVVRESVSYFLNRLGGISVDIEADNGLVLIEKLRTAKRLPDICIIDFEMPHMDGYEVLLKIRELWPEIKILVLTAFSNEPLIIKMIRAGANGYLLKNSKPIVIKEALQSIHETGFFYSEPATSAVFNKVAKSGDVELQEFTEDEIDFIKYTCADLTYKEMAEQMNRSVYSVEGFSRRVAEKIGVRTRTGIVMYAIQSRIVPVEISLLTTTITKKKKKP